MIVGFFSDDGSAHYAALLVSCGLAAVSRPVTIIDGSGAGRLSRDPTVQDVASGRMGLVDELASAHADGLDEVALVAPLAFLDDPDVMAGLDVAVVSGADPLQARRAKRRAELPSNGVAPREATSRHVCDPAMLSPWLLTFGTWRLAGNLAGPGFQGLGSAPAARTLPVEVPLRGRSPKAAMENGLPTLETLRIGILLAASLEVAAADTGVMVMESAGMAAMMSPQPHPADQALAERLTELADRLEVIECAMATRDAPRPHFPRSRKWRRRGNDRPFRTTPPGRSAASVRVGDTSARARSCSPR